MYKAIALVALLLSSSALTFINSDGSISIASDGLTGQAYGESSNQTAAQMPVDQLPLSDLRGQLGLVAGREGPGAPPPTNYFGANLDLFARAMARFKLDYELDLPSATEAFKDKARMSAVGSQLAAGDLKSASEILPAIDVEGIAKDQYPRAFDQNYPYFFTMLNLFGLNGQAVRIGADMAAANDANKFDRLSLDNTRAIRLLSLMGYAEALAASHSPEASIYIAKLEPSLQRGGLNGCIETWLGDYYESIGQPHKALSYYQPILESRKNDEREARAAAEKEGRAYIPDPDWAKYRDVLQTRMAEFRTEMDQYKLGSKVKRQQKHETSASNLVAEASADDIAFNQFDEPSSTQRAFVSSYVRLLKLIAAPHHRDTQSSVDELFALSANIKKGQGLNVYALNSFCFFVQLSRRFADAGDPNTADEILNRLVSREMQSRKYATRTIDLYMVDVDRALNASLTKTQTASSDALWHKIFAGGNEQGSREYEHLRDLACLYLQAGEYARAHVLLDRASTACHTQTDDAHLRAMTQSLLYLDRALLALDENQVESSQGFFKQALASASHLPIFAPSVRLNEYNDSFATRVVQMSRWHHKHGNDHSAQEILQAASAKFADKACWLGVFTEQNYSSRILQEMYLHEYLGRLQLAHQDSDNGLSRARRLINQAVCDAGADGNVPSSLLVLRAQCAMLQKDYKTAAGDYLRVASNNTVINSNLPTAVQPSLKCHYAQCALEAALKDPTIADETLAKIYQLLAQSTDDSKPREKLDFYEKAYVLFPPSSQDFQYTTQEIVGLSTALSSAEPDKHDALQERQLQLRRQIAERAEVKCETNASQLWIGLATAEVEAKLIDRALMHFGHAVDIKRSNKPNDNVDYFFSKIGNPFNALADAGRSDDVVALYKKFVEKATQLYGPNSREYRAALTNLFVFYIERNKPTEADFYLTQICAVDLRKIKYGVICSPIDSDELLNALKSLAEKPDKMTLVLNALHKIVKLQKARYGNNQRFESLYLLECAAIELKLNQLDAGLADAREAVAIEALYGEGAFSGQPEFSPYQQLMRAKGLEDDWLSTSKLIQQAFAERNAHSVEPPTDYDKLVQYRNWWQANAPYSSRLLSAQSLLLKAELDKRNWSAVKQTAHDLLQTLNFGQFYLNNPGNDMPNSLKKMFAYRCFIEACLEKGEVEQSIRMAKQALSEKTESPDHDELLFLAEMKIVCVDNSGALAYCRSALDLKAEFDDYRVGWIIESIYRQLNAKNDLQALFALRDKTADALSFAALQQFLASRKNGAFSRQFYKEPPIKVVQLPAKEGLSVSAWTPTPSEPYTFPMVEKISGRFSFNYAALASFKLEADKDVRCMALSDKQGGQAYTFAGSLRDGGFVQTMHRAGNLIFAYDGAPNTLIPIDQSAPPSSAAFTSPPAVMSQPFLDAITVPSGAITLDKVAAVLPAGDYVIGATSVSGIHVKDDQHVRIFLKAAAPEPQLKIISLRPGPYAPALVDNAIFKLDDGGVAGGPKFELWYNGEDTIKLGDNTKFRGIIYAPHAAIEIGKNAEFIGAMVADKIHFSEGARVMYDPALLNWTQGN